MSALNSLRDGDFVTPARARRIAIGLIIAFIAALAWLGVTAHGLSDFKGRPLGTDFSDIYAAGRFIAQGHAAAAYDPARQHGEEQAIFGEATPFYGWHYPPFFLLVAAPLGHLPYLSALALWQAASFALYLAAMALLMRRLPLSGLRTRDWLLFAIAFPAVFVNLTHGHNGFLTAALMTFALALLDERPLIAGLCIGLLVYKPQFGILIPLVLAATGRWRTFASATVTVLALAALVTALFGVDIWSAFLASTHFTRTEVLEQGGTGFWKIQSVFAAVRLWGGPVPLAYIVQGVVTLTVAVLLTRLWRSNAPFARKAAALPIAAILATPYSLDYDMMVLAPSIALLASDGLTNGFRSWEKTALAALWLVPVMTRSIADATHIPLGVTAMLTMFALVTLGEPRETIQTRTVPQAAS